MQCLIMDHSLPSVSFYTALCNHNIVHSVQWSLSIKDIGSSNAVLTIFVHNVATHVDLNFLESDSLERHTQCTSHTTAGTSKTIEQSVVFNVSLWFPCHV